jgi:hypothetical protein
VIDVIPSFKGLDLDTDLFSLPKGFYIDALNISRDTVSANKDLSAVNIVGNRLVDYDLPAGTNTCIGAYGVLVRNTVIYFVYNNAGRHSILEYDNSTRTITKIFENLTDSDDDILGFNLLSKINSINVYIRDEGDLLFFLDSLGRPTTMNIQKFKDGDYTPVTRAIIDLHKAPPLSPPDAVYDNDASVGTNDTRNKLFRFKYRWIYDDNEKSTWSPISAVPYPVSILDADFTNVPTNNNVIHIQMNSGPQNVKSIELAVSFVNKVSQWPENFQSVVEINKDEESIDDDIDFNYDFFNDSTYPTVNPEEDILDFDRVPRYAKSQEMPNGNVLVYAGVTEGYDKDLDPNVVITINTIAAGNGGTIGSLNGVTTITLDNGLTQAFNIVFSGVPATGTVVEVEVQQVSGGAIFLAATYTTLAGDTASSVAAAISASFDALNEVFDASVVGNTVFVVANAPLDPKRIFHSLTITPPGSSADNDSIATWKWSTSRNIGLIYFDSKGVTNGVLYNAKIVFPAYAENGSDVPLLPYINVKIYHEPPEWASSYQFVMSKEPTTYLFWECIAVDDNEADFIYFDVSNIAINNTQNPTVASVLSYSFQDGDRMRLIRRMSDGNVFSSSYDAEILGQIIDPIVSGVPINGTFIKIRNTTLFDAVDYSSEFFVIEIYRPGQSAPSETNQVYYEFGEQYPIINPATEERVHGGQVTNQSTDFVTPAEVNLYEGDSYFRARTVYLSESGIGTFNVQDRNFVDSYPSAVSSVDGRPSVIEINARSATYGATIRFGQAYQANTNVNGFNRFYAEDFIDCDLSYGDIMRLKVRDRFMRVFQRLKTGVVPLFNQISKNADGNEISVVTNQLLNPVQYYAGDYGIGDCPESLSSYNFADYFADNIRGAIIRVSNDGNTPISVLYKVNSWSIEQLPLRGQTFKAYGAYDQRINNYILALEAAVIPGTLYVPNQYRIPDIGRNLFVFELTGVAANGDIINVHLQNGDGIERDYSYTVVGSSTTISQILINLRNQINADIYFTAGLEIFDPTTMLISQDTENNPDSYNGLVTISYGSQDVVVPASTLSFDEEGNAFEGFLSYSPEMMTSLGTLLIAFKNGQLWTFDSTRYNSFFGVDYESSITPVFNDVPLQKKSQLSISENASSTWDCPVIYSNVNTYGNQRQETNLVSAEFTVLEGMPTASIKRDANSPGGKINGYFMKGNWLAVKFRKENASTLEYLSIVSLNYNNSPLTKL